MESALFGALTSVCTLFDFAKNFLRRCCMKKLFSSFIALILCVCVFSSCGTTLSQINMENSDMQKVPEINNQSKESDGLEYTQTLNSSYYVSGIGTCTDTDIVIPDTYNNLPVEGISDSAFSDNNSIKSITIPNTIKRIDSRAFYSCAMLERVILDKQSSQLEFIGESAFSTCIRLESFCFPVALEELGKHAFAHTNLHSIDLSNNFKIFGEGAFLSCHNLISVTIPKGVTNLGYRTFAGCWKLVEIINLSDKNVDSGMFYSECPVMYIHDGVSKIVTKDNCYFITDKNGIHYLLGYVSNQKEIILPSDYLGDKYRIHLEAFANISSKLEEITIPISVEEIGGLAFNYCLNLKSINYMGTIDEWTSIKFHPQWDMQTGDYTIHCSNGDIKK